MTHIVTCDQAGRTVKSILKHTLQVSSSAISRLTRQNNGILCNGVPVRSTYVVSAHDVLTLSIGDEGPLIGASYPLPIIYEDGYMLVLNKPAGMAVHHSTLNPDTPTVQQALHGLMPFHPVNRLDKGTSGLMVVAKSGYVHSLLQQCLHSGGFQRTYLAVCQGCPCPETGMIDAPIGRKVGSAIERCVTPEGAPALSAYRVLSQSNDRSLVWLQPHTGRTHQLRVHMAHLGCPLVGDWLYGTECQHIITRPALHSAALTMIHPITKVPLVLNAPLPQDMERLLHRKTTIGSQNLSC